MVSAESFFNSSLQRSNKGEAIARILAAAIKAVEPGEAIRRSVRRTGVHLVVAGRQYELSHYRQLAILGIGKGSLAMAGAITELVAGFPLTGLVVTKHLPAANDGVIELPLEVVLGGHPVPDENSLLAGRKVVEFISNLQPSDLLICLISGGGSSLVAAPVDGVNLADLQVLTTALLSCGARIEEINILRRHLDQLKGGRLAKLAEGMDIIGLILSDVVGNPLETIASGPTAPDPSTLEDCYTVLSKYGLEKITPKKILQALVDETPKPGDMFFSRVHNVLVASNLHAAQASLKQAQMEGFHPYLLRTDLQGEARTIAVDLATYLRQAWQTGDPVPRPACIVAGGETTVTLQGNGKGGRNTEMALAAVIALASFPNVMMITLATDGEDGPTDAAGAVVTGETFRHALQMGMDPGDFLATNDSFNFFSSLGDLLQPGPTGTNVNDLVFLFTFS